MPMSNACISMFLDLILIVINSMLFLVDFVSVFDDLAMIVGGFVIDVCCTGICLG